MKAALEGIRVLEWSYYHYGPAATSLLGDLGAEVIKIEDPRIGDPCRQVEWTAGIPLMNRKGSSGLYEGINRSKKSITLDLKREEGRQIVYEMLPKFDVFLTTFRRRACDALGMDYETLKRYNPRIIYAHGNAFGQQGPERDLPGQDNDGQSRAGMALAQRGPNEGPMTRLGLCDQMGAISAAFGILAALVARERLGISQKVETSLLGGLLWLEKTLLTLSLASGREPEPQDHDNGLALWNFYQASDGKWFCLSFGMGMDTRWPNFCQAIAQPELENDPRFVDLNGRTDNRRALIAILDKVFKQRTREEWLQRFVQWDCPASPANRISDLINYPQATENQYIIEYDDPILGKQRAGGYPVALSETPMRMSSVAPQHGQHTEEVLLELGGYTWNDIARFRDNGVIA